MQQLQEIKKLKAVKHALSIMRAEQIEINEDYLKNYFVINNIRLVNEPVLRKKRSEQNGYNGGNR